MKPAIWCGVAMVGALGIGMSTDGLRPIVNPKVRISGLDVHDSAVSGSLLGQFRTSISAYLWVQSDLYLHNGVQMRPLTEAEIKSGQEVMNSANDGHEKLHNDVVTTVIPPKERDFRGIFGDVERATSAWKNMKNHTHNDPSQSLPLFRLMTWLDPSFIDGWTTGAMVIARDHSGLATGKAVDFLKEGLAENPESIDILTSIAYIELTRRKNMAVAVSYLEKARALGWAHRTSMPANEREAFENTYRWLALCYRDLGRRQDVIAVCQEGLSLFSDDKVLPRLLDGAIKGEKGPGKAADDAKTLRDEDEEHGH
jgi:tetratricopeptide (TPR) repeat protein